MGSDKLYYYDVSVSFAITSGKRLRSAGHPFTIYTLTADHPLRTISIPFFDLPGRISPDAWNNFGKYLEEKWLVCFSANSQKHRLPQRRNLKEDLDTRIAKRDHLTLKFRCHRAPSELTHYKWNFAKSVMSYFSSMPLQEISASFKLILAPGCDWQKCLSGFSLGMAYTGCVIIQIKRERL